MKLPNFQGLRVCVVGDVMLDRYWHGDTDRISPEAPVPVVHISRIEERVGGAGNVAVNCAALGAHVTLISCVGKDDGAARLSELLTEQGIETGLIAFPDCPTITKLRVLGRSQQLIRLDFERSFKEATEQLFSAYEAVLAQSDVVILSDYAKGVLEQPQLFIQAAKQQGIPVVVDPKHQDWSIYSGASVLTPNLKEFQQAVGKRCLLDGDIETEARYWLEKADIEAVLVTRGASGMSLVASKGEAVHIPTHAKEVYDVTGAGDTVIAVLGSILGAGHSLKSAAVWANKAAGKVVGKVGTASITPEELMETTQLQTKFKAVSEAALQQAIAPLKAQGRRIVMTNGCFDILHPGHVHYLEQAKAQGDILIIAVNDDESVRRLKGSQRPIHHLEHRMQVLAGLQSVDWVVPFSEDTPRRLIASILPDVLCKGGDYEVHEIAGSQEVLDNGGEVKILSFVDGFSTTSTVEKINQELNV